MIERRTTTTTMLFTDLVNSTELLQRAGDEHAQRIFQAHHKALKESVAANGGHAVKWLGDGLMVAFPSAADAVRCAIAMQRAARRPLAGERLAIRVGLNVGEAVRDEGDYFGTAVVIAKRLCDYAHAGQILCSATVAQLLAGRQAFNFHECGTLDLKGLAAPVSACEVAYQRDQPAALLAHTPFVGRAAELAKLQAKFAALCRGGGGLVMLTGEPGIGKTRTTEEFADAAKQSGALVLRGACYEGEWQPPFGPFSEAIAGYAGVADPDAVRQDLGTGGAPIARLVPALRDRVPEIPEPIAL
ncbi:MAG TPA: adenylate/guanylate cyclase domain-containing protein, partial [Candidatus Kryptonia bacterium]|nr:adenylate/guanylate cyclase domain-containing protein [Candidatus Kryptonia bacterium]